MAQLTLVLASASAARLATLRRAGIEPAVRISNVDESLVAEDRPAVLASLLAGLKGEAVVAQLAADPLPGRVLVVGCDSVLEVDGMAYGKPGSAAVAAERLRQLRGRSAVLHTGHHLTDLGTGGRLSATAATTVMFGQLSDGEIDAYVATGEPIDVAGSFTIDGLGGAFVDGVEGDPSNVVGISLPLLRRLVNDLGLAWQDLWNRRGGAGFGAGREDPG